MLLHPKHVTDISLRNPGTLLVYKISNNPQPKLNQKQPPPVFLSWKTSVTQHLS